MPLLTRDERENLSKDEKKAIRKERRKERRKRTAEKFRKIFQFKVFEELAKETIRDLADDVLPRDEELDEVLDELIDRIDEFMDFRGLGLVGSILEMIDGLIISVVVKELLRPQVERIYDELEEKGLLSEEDEPEADEEVESEEDPADIGGEDGQ